MTMEEKVLTLLKARRTTDLIDELKQHPALVDTRDTQGVSLLSLSFYYGNTELSDYLLAHKANLDIFEASAAGHLDKVKAFITAHRDQLNAFSADGFTPLGLACFFARTPVAEYLLGAGADPSLASRNAFHVAPLHSAAAARATDIVRLLLEHHADVQATQQGNNTALHSAAHHGDLEMTRILLRYGANPQAKTDQGQTPYDMAIEKGFAEVAALLRGGG